MKIKRSTLRSRPPGANTTPTSPSTSAGWANRAACAKAIAPLAQFRAPCTSVGLPEAAAALSTRTTTSGSSTARSPLKSPPRKAATKALTTSRWQVRSVLTVLSAPCTRRRARLAGCLACRPRNYLHVQVVETDPMAGRAFTAEPAVAPTQLTWPRSQPGPQPRPTAGRRHRSA